MQKKTKSAVLLINLGSPDTPTSSALRVYLSEFLSDPRVIDLPRWQWLPILAVILLIRPKRSAKLYQSIWTDAGSPLTVITKKQTEALREKLFSDGNGQIIVDYAMRYGNPSITDKLSVLKAQGINQILLVPMYPQYCDATTASVLDAVADAFRKMRYVPEWRFVHDWHDHPLYIQALAKTVVDYVQEKGMPDKLLVSFHGVPRRYFTEGDPYYRLCQETTKLLQEALQFGDEQIELVFQSRFGREEWLQPYADKTIEKFAQDGVKSVAVICPGFTADCLETLEEMAEENKEVFLENGGESYDYIPALNDSPLHIALLKSLILSHTQDWENFSLDK